MNQTEKAEQDLQKIEKLLWTNGMKIETGISGELVITHGGNEYFIASSPNNCLPRITTKQSLEKV